MDPWRLACLGALALCAASASTGAVVTEQAPYVAPTRGAAFWCEAGGHAYLPPEEWSGDPATTVAWALSGEPQCLATDLATDNGEAGIGGAAFDVAGLGGLTAVVAIFDDQMGPNAPLSARFGAEEARACGSGVVTGTLGDQGTLWALVGPLDVDVTTNNVCMATQGLLTLTV